MVSGTIADKKTRKFRTQQWLSEQSAQNLSITARICNKDMCKHSPNTKDFEHDFKADNKQAPKGGKLLSAMAALDLNGVGSWTESVHIKP